MGVIIACLRWGRRRSCEACRGETCVFLAQWLGVKAERSLVWAGRLREASVVSEQLRASLLITECDRERTRCAVVYWISQIYPDSDYIP